MKMTAVALVVLSGLCFLPVCSPRLYFLVEKSKTWADAQSYCRERYTDLAVVRNELDLAKLNDLIGWHGNIWIGLQADTKAWRWSLENPDYYGEEEAGFRMWAHSEPNAGSAYYRVCALMSKSGKWIDTLCHFGNQFICYNGTAAEEMTSSSLVLVKEFKTWNTAQKYCREHYIDLVSVRSKAENDQVAMIVQSPNTWIGLYRDSWKWSDGSSPSFSNWAAKAPSTTTTHSCAVSHFGKWVNRDCNSQLQFVCYSTPKVRKQVVQVVLKTTDPKQDMENLKEEILKKFKQRLEDEHLSEDVKIRWVEQPDGKVFHKKNTKKP